MSGAFASGICAGRKARLVGPNAFFPAFAIRIGVTPVFFGREAS